MTTAESRPLKVAVIGAGMAGLSAAWHLHHTGHLVTVYAGGPHVGGYHHTYLAQTGAGEPVAVDTGFSLFQEAASPNLMALLRALQAPVQEGAMSFGASLNDGYDEFASTSLFAKRRNLLNPDHWRMKLALGRFAREAPHLLRSDETPTLGEYLSAHHYPEIFIEHYLVPLAAALWLAPAGQVLEMPARAFIRHLVDQGLLRGHGGGWLSVTGGSRQLIERMTADFAHRIRPVAASRVRRSRAGVFVEGEGGFTEFDHVVMACQPDEALALLTDPTADEASLLAVFQPTPHRAVLHQDDSLMPVRDRAWASLNILSLTPEMGSGPVSLSYWINNIQDIPDDRPLFLSLDPPHAPAPEVTAWEGRFTTILPTMESAAAQTRLPRLQGRQGTWYCGGWCGMDMIEDAVTAGLTVAEALSGVARPWQVREVSAAAFHVWPAAAPEQDAAA